jgi:hypothetical protein
MGDSFYHLFFGQRGVGTRDNKNLSHECYHIDKTKICDKLVIICSTDENESCGECKTAQVSFCLHSNHSKRSLKC